MTSNNIGLLQEKRRTALLEYCIGQVKAERYPPLLTPEDVFELLRIDPLDSARVQTSGVAEAISCAQQYISAVYNKMEPGFENHEFPRAAGKLGAVQQLLGLGCSADDRALPGKLHQSVRPSA